MNPWGELAVALGMAVGLVGVVVPLLPGLVLVWGAAMAWVILDGGGAVRWSLAVVMTALLLAGLLAGWLLPARAAAGERTARGTLLWAALGGLVGFLVIPVLGVVVGFVLGVLVAESVARRDVAAGAKATGAVLRAYGVGVLLQLLAGVLIVGTWVVGLALV